MTPDLTRRRLLAAVAAAAAGLSGCTAAPGGADPTGAAGGALSAGGPARRRGRPRRPVGPASGRDVGTGPSGSSPPAEPGPPAAPTPPSAAPTPSASRQAPGAEPSPAPASTTAQPSPSDTEPLGLLVARVTDVPVGGGVVLGGLSLVLTQPVAGQIRGFDSHCTHNGCPVDTVTESTIVCPCHGSRFSVADGSPVAGPAVRSLAPRTLTVRDGGIHLG